MKIPEYCHIIQLTPTQPAVHHRPLPWRLHDVVGPVCTFGFSPLPHLLSGFVLASWLVSRFRGVLGFVAGVIRYFRGYSLPAVLNASCEVLWLGWTFSFRGSDSG